MNSQIDRAHMKQVALTRFDIQLLTLLMKTGGEYAMPDTAEAKAGIAYAAQRNLVTVIQRPGERLNDFGVFRESFDERPDAHDTCAGHSVRAYVFDEPFLNERLIVIHGTGPGRIPQESAQIDRTLNI